MKAYKFELFTAEIEKYIREGVYKPGHKLPSVRGLKRQYGTSMTTIQNGYEHLVLLGLVVSIPKSGYYVAARPQPAEKQRLTDQPVVRDAVFERNVQLISASQEDKKVAEFNVAMPGDLIISQKLILRTMQQAIREKGVSLLRYYPAGGSETLKANIVKHAAAYQTLLNPRELLITDGALQALYIALASVCRAGDVVAVESPCVFSVLEVIRVLGLKVIEIPVRPMTGFDADFFRNAARHNRIKALIITPNFHNPTGLLLGDDARQELVRVAQQYAIAVIENDIYGDLHFGGQRPRTLKSYDESGLVMTYSSYAKTLAPGVRLGWLSAGRFLKQAEQVRYALGITVSPVYQETVNRLLSTSSYDRHLRAFRLLLARNAHFTVNLLAENFPEGTFVVPPAGGYNSWVEMPDRIDMEKFYQTCDRIGVRFTPGYTFSFSNRFTHNFRLVFADKYAASKVEALRQLGAQIVR